MMMITMITNDGDYNDGDHDNDEKQERYVVGRFGHGTFMVASNSAIWSSSARAVATLRSDLCGQRRTQDTGYGTHAEWLFLLLAPLPSFFSGHDWEMYVKER